MDKSQLNFEILANQINLPPYRQMIMDLLIEMHRLHVDDFYNELINAKAKHPMPPDMACIFEEWNEFLQAYNANEIDHAKEEGHHTMVTIHRYITEML